MEKRTDNPSLSYQAAARGLMVLDKFPFGRVTASGLENIADEGPQLFAYSHHNSWDVPGLGLAVFRYNRRMVHFLAKEELLGKLAVGPLLRSMQALPINRDGNATTSQLREALRVLEEGGLLALAPEGGRVNGPKIAELKGGVGFLAVRGSASVVPIGIAGKNLAPPAGPFLPRPMHLHFGEPLTATGKAGRQAIDRELHPALQEALDTADRLSSFS